MTTLIQDLKIVCFVVTITSRDGNLTFKGFLVEVFTDQTSPRQFKEGEFTVPSIDHTTCSGVRCSLSYIWKRNLSLVPIVEALVKGNVRFCMAEILLIRRKKIIKESLKKMLVLY